MSLVPPWFASVLCLSAIQIVGNPRKDNFVAQLEMILEGVSIGWHVSAILLKSVNQRMGYLHKLNDIKLCMRALSFVSAFPGDSVIVCPPDRFVQFLFRDLVIQDGFGVNDGRERLCQRFCCFGFRAMM